MTATDTTVDPADVEPTEGTDEQPEQTSNKGKGKGSKNGAANGNSDDASLKAVRKAVVKSERTPHTIAEKAGVTLQTARKHLKKLVEDGEIQIAGKHYTGGRGRPANTYTKA